MLLVISGVIFALLRLVKRRPLLALASVIVTIILFFVIQWMIVPIPWRHAEETFLRLFAHLDRKRKAKAAG